MDITGATVAKTAIDLAKTDNVLNKATGIMGMLFPYAGIKQKTVNMYLDEIEKSDMPLETKVFLALNTKKEFKKIRNQSQVAQIAIDSAKKDTDFSDRSGVNEEWLDRFMDSAGFVSSEEIQIIWGKILANEFDNPGSTPPNMIRILSEITPNLAIAFRKICSMSIWILPLKDDGNIESGFKKLFVPFQNHDDRMRELGIGFDVLNELETLGVIRFKNIGGYISKGLNNEKILICLGDNLELIEEHKGDNIPIGNVIFTSVGEALSTITDPVDIEG